MRTASSTIISARTRAITITLSACRVTRSKISISVWGRRSKQEVAQRIKGALFSHILQLQGVSPRMPPEVGRGKK